MAATGNVKVMYWSSFIYLMLTDIRVQWRTSCPSLRHDGIMACDYFRPEIADATLHGTGLLITHFMTFLHKRCNNTPPFYYHLRNPPEKWSIWIFNDWLEWLKCVIFRPCCDYGAISGPSLIISISSMEVMEENWVKTFLVKKTLSSFRKFYLTS